MLAQNSERVYIAGDDDQAIFRWAGADVDHLDSISQGNAGILDQSYRIPRADPALADRVIRGVKTRGNTTWKHSRENRQENSEAS